MMMRDGASLAPSSKRGGALLAFGEFGRNQSQCCRCEAHEEHEARGGARAREPLESTCVPKRRREKSDYTHLSGLDLRKHGREIVDGDFARHLRKESLLHALGPPIL